MQCDCLVLFSYSLGCYHRKYISEIECLVPEDRSKNSELQLKILATCLVFELSAVNIQGMIIFMN